MSIAENVANIKARIREAAIAAGRDPSEIKLCAATKMNDADAVRQAIAAGVDLCGENRVQELVQKGAENAYAGVPVHFIGHLQTNKVRQVVGKVDLIQSVDRMKLLDAIQAEAQKQGIVQDILLEINIGEEASKSGFSIDEIMDSLIEQIALANEADGGGNLSIDERLARQEKIEKLQKQIEKTETAAWKEQQPKKKFELYSRAQEYRKKLEDIKHG